MHFFGLHHSANRWSLTPELPAIKSWLIFDLIRIHHSLRSRSGQLQFVQVMLPEIVECAIALDVLLELVVGQHFVGGSLPIPKSFY